jgi:hypothetical protein
MGTWHQTVEQAIGIDHHCTIAERIFISRSYVVTCGACDLRVERSYLGTVEHIAQVHDGAWSDLPGSIPTEHFAAAEHSAHPNWPVLNGA